MRNDYSDAHGYLNRSAHYSYHTICFDGIFGNRPVGYDIFKRIVEINTEQGEDTAQCNQKPEEVINGYFLLWRLWRLVVIFLFHCEIPSDFFFQLVHLTVIRPGPIVDFGGGMDLEIWA